MENKTKTAGTSALAGTKRKTVGHSLALAYSVLLSKKLYINVQMMMMMMSVQTDDLKPVWGPIIQPIYLIVKQKKTMVC